MGEVKDTTLWNRMRRPLELLLWAGVLGFVLLRIGPQFTAMFGLGAGDDALSVTAFTTLDGEEFSRADLQGKVLLVNAWATWCGPCVLEMPGFQKVYDDYKDQGFLVLGVSRDHEGPQKVRAFLQQKSITYPVAMAADVDLGGITEVTTLPTSYLIGKDGTIRHRVEGIYFGPTLRMAVKRLLAED